MAICWGDLSMCQRKLEDNEPFLRHYLHWWATHHRIHRFLIQILIHLAIWKWISLRLWWSLSSKFWLSIRRTYHQVIEYCCFGPSECAIWSHKPWQYCLFVVVRYSCSIFSNESDQQMIYRAISHHCICQFSIWRKLGQVFSSFLGDRFTICSTLHSYHHRFWIDDLGSCMISQCIIRMYLHLFEC